MQIIDTTEFELQGEYSVAIGKFDGIHRGHKKLIDTIMSYKENGMKTAVFTFEPSPVAFFGNGTYKGLTTRDEKRHIFEKLGVDVLIEYPLNKESASVSAKNFVTDILIKKMHTKVIVCGPDFTFGDKGSGNVATLKSLGDELGYEVVVCEKVKRIATDLKPENNKETSVCGVLNASEDISSTLIRKEVEAGQMELVTEHIGAYYSVTGVVVKGKQIGRTIGLPTINIVPQEDKLLPPYGVYEALVSVQGGRYKGITNIGVKPTVTEEKKVVVETFILDYSGDLYGSTITVNLLRMVRPERKFGSIEELKAQIESDIKSIQ